MLAKIQPYFRYYFNKVSNTVSDLTRDRKSKPDDEYNWATYTSEYSRQLKEEVDKNAQFFLKDFEIKDGEVIFRDPNFHPNFKTLYDLAFSLKVNSIFECGCGGGYHLKNLRTLLPDAKISGCDLLQTQIDFAKGFSGLEPEIQDSLRAMSMIEEPLKYDVGKWEFVYSQAVIMHLSRENAKAFLRNMGRLSSKYIAFTEGKNNHADFKQMVQDTLPDWEVTAADKYIPDCEGLPASARPTCAFLLTKK